MNSDAEAKKMTFIAGLCPRVSKVLIQLWRYMIWPTLSGGLNLAFIIYATGSIGKKEFDCIVLDAKPNEPLFYTSPK